MASKLDEATQKDPKTRATLIFFQFQSGKSIFAGYKELCKRMGSKFMDYPEFEFWWQRFSADNFDLEYDRSQDPKYRTITDMPVQVFEKICENLGDNYKEEYWFTFRHVSKSFRTIIDSWKAPFETIRVYCYRKSIILEFDTFQFTYLKKSEKLSEITDTNKRARSEKKFARSGNYQDLAADDLLSVLVSPGGYKPRQLIISEKFDNGFAQKLLDKSRNLATSIDVDTVVLSCIDSIPIKNILNAFQSIKKIDILPENGQKFGQEFVDTINEITALKNVEMIEISLGNGDNNLIPSDLKIPKMTLNFIFVTAENLLRIIKILLQSPHLQYCRLDMYSTYKTRLLQMWKTLGIKKIPKIPNMYKYQIPDSDEFFEIERVLGNDSHITLTRKSSSA
ncbi:hypothetical protein B9Z55_027005 [Caenorhabditis nigoni]|uniref:Mos1 transposase HTH domain-containing protein n=1 Tax=Caenorhabditis nigoni TaxID=1611254 RepID=A0A2G5SIV2_9PELO|nr:hypothetical protein B9Z55_027005 [Caenorhabditis nigoni]